VNWRERRVAQILRDFMEAYGLSAEVGARLRAGDLDFARVNRLVGESEESALFRLKEECHALFRFDKESSESELQAEELFDLAVGALFHEAMKFREGYYLTTSYGPRLESMMSEERATGPLAEAFLRVIEAGRQRMLESEVEMAELFDETRDQLAILLRQLPGSGAVARSLLEDPERTCEVFGSELQDLLESIYSDVAAGYQLAVEDLIENGHYAEATELMEREDTREADIDDSEALRFAGAMERYFAGESEAALETLSQWVKDGAPGNDHWRLATARVLEAMTENESDVVLAEHARGLLEELRKIPSD
jgi:hypothetical protein